MSNQGEGKKGFSRLDSPNHQGETDTWLTPLSIIQSLGEFELDPCGFAGHQTAKKLIVLPSDGLAEPWQGRVWLNPPYGKQTGWWLKKLQEHGNGIALVFARTETAWFQNLNPDMVFLLQGRIKFLKPDFTEGTNAGHGSMLLAFGRANAGAILSSDLKGRWLK
jgi:hypothetical protein